MAWYWWLMIYLICVCIIYSLNIKFSVRVSVNNNRHYSKLTTRQRKYILANPFIEIPEEWNDVYAQIVRWSAILVWPLVMIASTWGMAILILIPERKNNADSD